MFRTVRLSIIRSLFTVHSAMVYGIQVCRQLSSLTRMEYLVLLQSCMTYTYNKIQSYLAENRLRLYYENRSVNDVKGMVAVDSQSYKTLVSGLRGQHAD